MDAHSCTNFCRDGIKDAWISHLGLPFFFACFLLFIFFYRQVQTLYSQPYQSFPTACLRVPIIAIVNTFLLVSKYQEQEHFLSVMWFGGEIFSRYHCLGKKTAELQRLNKVRCKPLQLRNSYDPPRHSYYCTQKNKRALLLNQPKTKALILSYQKVGKKKTYSQKHVHKCMYVK